ncbi:transcription termination factor 2 [Drosophila obscura]|uniref:transcription termination factor 2 n=1 Tax=Drosophila obscura TaxID=7282 RepID=UPI001BB23185|nr:transcription termination factor 2 [Drosophila obscura]XP_041449466.1 transcription termination factor 2 [Drosophila obscura]
MPPKRAKIPLATRSQSKDNRQSLRCPSSALKDMENQTLRYSVFNWEIDLSDEDQTHDQAREVFSLSPCFETVENDVEIENQPVPSYESEDTKFDFSSEYANETDALIVVSSAEYQTRKTDFDKHVKRVLALEQRKRELEAGALHSEELENIKAILQKDNDLMLIKGELLDALLVDEEQRENSEPQGSVKPKWSNLFSGLNRHRDKAATTPAEFYQHKANIISSLKTIYEPKEPTPSGDEFAEQSSLLLVGLLKHQKSGLRWMQFRERQEICGGILADDMGLGKTLSMISLILASLEAKKLKQEKKKKALEAKWSKIFERMPVKKMPKFHIFDDDDDEEEQEDQKAEESYEPPPKRPCPEISHVAESEEEEDEEDERGPYPAAGTLVVCPLSVMYQWSQEVASKVAPNAIKVLIFHGPNRHEISLEQFRSHDLVITTYHTVASEVGKRGNSSRLLAVQWKRLILDEAHIIRNTKTYCFQSVYLLRAHCRWALTGTPVQNRAIDVFALLRFLNVPHFTDLNRWKKDLNNGMQGHFRLSLIIKPLMLRRTKQELQASGDMPPLPELRVELVNVELSEPEMAVYQIMSAISKKIFTQFLMQREVGNNDLNYYSAQQMPQFITNNVEEKYIKIYERFLRSLGYDPKEKVMGIVILVLLLRLRQFCCHPCLMIKMFLSMDEAMPMDDLRSDVRQVGGSLQIDALKELENYSAGDCSSDDAAPKQAEMKKKIKKEEIQTQVKVENIKWDKVETQEEPQEGELKIKVECIKKEEPLYPKTEETKGDNIKKKDENVLSDLAGAMRLLNIKNPIFNSSQSSAKMKIVIQKLQSILVETTDKVIVVSQWTSFLDVIKDYLQERDWQTLDFNGKMDAKQREEVLKEFNTVANDKRVLLLSLTAGGVGLNLNVANHLLLVDLHWNPQLERQAQDRIYRYGQQKPTFIYRFMCQDTVEQRIKALQDYKLEISNVVLQPDQSAWPSAGGGLSMEDLKKLILK